MYREGSQHGKRSGFPTGVQAGGGQASPIERQKLAYNRERDRGEETDESDVDMLLFLKGGADRKSADSRVSDISHQVYLDFGCSTMHSAISETEHQRKLKRKQGF